MVTCVDRVRKKIDKFLDLIYKSNSNNKYIKSDTIDILDKSPRVFRGITRIETIKQCLDNNINFYYIDTGYMGCYPEKNWHRFVKNNFQSLNHIDLTKDKEFVNRFKNIMNVSYDNYKPVKQIKGENILLIPPSEKVLKCLTTMKHVDFKQDEFIDYVIKEVKKYSDRKVIVRQKPNRDERITKGRRLEDQLRNDKIHCLIAFNSIAAFEAIQLGYSSITLGPNAASYLSEKELSKIDEPYFPDEEKIRKHSLFLTACQFNKEEFRNGYALKIIEQIQQDQTYYNFKFKCQ
jgi:hypothetical protein